MTNILDLIEGDWVQFMGDNQQSQYGKFELFVEDMVSNALGAKLKLPNGQTYMLTEDDDFVIVDYPINFKVDNVHQPAHYHSENGIDLIEFCRQQFTDEEFRGAMKFTQMRYSLRTGRKENDVQDQSKLKEYADRFMEVLNNATR
ncbi:DUF3310 domain-containing protein [Staphylococcus devriesei]|uniref:DUF3310 domain-containing protein n=1 Tax=Staphylococcus devriesei TaxID=586733 RepID=A0ABX5I0I1_9STAP|nr:DUF3310 domain-containing protein [Staphylococcus devriesei]PTF13275.1 hypothetical protein BUY47_09380 [Staphylococcus devriesei]